MRCINYAFPVAAPFKAIWCAACLIEFFILRVALQVFTILKNANIKSYCVIVQTVPALCIGDFLALYRAPLGVQCILFCISARATYDLHFQPIFCSPCHNTIEPFAGVLLCYRQQC